MSNEYDPKQIKSLICSILDELEANFKRPEKKMLPLEKVYPIMLDLKALFNTYSEQDRKDCGKIVIKRYIKLINLLIALEKEGSKLIEYHDQLKNAYKLAARVSLEHFLIYYEWDSDDKVYEKRVNILQGYVYFLNTMCYNRKIRKLIVNMPSGYGKTRPEKLYEAFRLGIDPTITFMSVSSNDRLLRQTSRSVIDIIKSPQYGEVFPELDYETHKKTLFLKETDEDWKLKDCHLQTSYITTTRDATATGFRCSASTHIDDLYNDAYEAMSKELNDRVYNKYQMVWTERTVKGKTPQIIVTMTRWGVDDLISRLINDEKSKQPFHPHPKFKYCEISEDEEVVIIRVPALDENDESTCPELASTKELIEKRNKLDTWLWETNYQQNAVAPEGLEFDWERLTTYDSLPVFEDNYAFASLDPARRGNDYVSMPIFKRSGDYFYLVDCLFSNTSMQYLYDRIVDKIIEHDIIKFVVENNVDTSLKTLLEQKLKERGYNFCTIYEIYNTGKKEGRINDQKDIIRDKIIFPRKGMYGENTEMGKALRQMTTYSFMYPNKHDDMIDSLAMFANEIILGNAEPQRATAVRRLV